MSKIILEFEMCTGLSQDVGQTDIWGQFYVYISLTEDPIIKDLIKNPIYPKQILWQGMV
jgi:hypothetical protein